MSYRGMSYRDYLRPYVARDRRHFGNKHLLSLGLVLLVATALLAQGIPQKPLMVNGKSVGTVVQLNGRSYVELDTLAQITNGSVAIEPNQVVLTLRTAPAGTASASPDPGPILSRDFARLAIAELAEMREWRGAIGTILTYGVPVVGTWPQDYHDRAEGNLRQVAVTATTPADQDALQLLRNEFGNLSQWASGVVAARQSLNATNSVNPNAMQNDSALAKVTDCSGFLNSMLVSGQFADSPNCH